MAKYLAIFNDSIDGIDVCGFTIMTEKQMLSYEDIALSIGWQFDYSEGETTFSFSSGDELLEKIEFKEISQQEANLMKKLFGEKFGYFIDEDVLFDLAHDDEDDEDGDMIGRGMGFDDDDDDY